MSSFKFELNPAGVADLMKSSEMAAALIANANEVKDRAGDGYDVHIGPTRANVSVMTESEEAARDNMDNNTLLKAVRG